MVTAALQIPRVFNIELHFLNLLNSDSCVPLALPVNLSSFSKLLKALESQRHTIDVSFRMFWKGSQFTSCGG